MNNEVAPLVTAIVSEMLSPAPAGSPSVNTHSAAQPSRPGQSESAAAADALFSNALVNGAGGAIGTAAANMFNHGSSEMISNAFSSFTNLFSGRKKRSAKAT